MLAKKCDVSNPEQVKEYVANAETSNNSTRTLAVASYKTFADLTGIQFKPPRYPPEEKNPLRAYRKRNWRPHSRLQHQKAALLQLLKETAMRIGGTRNLKRIDIDLQNSRITLNNTEKKGKFRLFKISPKLAAMLNALPKEDKGQFKSCTSNIYRDYENQRKTIQKTPNPTSTANNLSHLSPLEGNDGIR
jgi:integrase